MIGDFRAQIAAGYVGGERVVALTRETGIGSLEDIGDEIIGRSEATMRAGIRELGEGTRQLETPIGVSNEKGEPLKVSLTLTVKGDEMFADFSGTSPQVRSPINCPYNFTATYVIVPAKMICAPDTPNNEGTFRPFHFNIPEGCILNPRYPAAVYWRFTSGHIVADLAHLLLAQVAPERSLAGSGTLPTWYFHTSGVRQDGTMFMLHSHGFGGMGGRSGRDGLSAVGFPYTVRNVPVEEVETETPLLCLGRRYIADSGGRRSVARRHGGGDNHDHGPRGRRGHLEPAAGVWRGRAATLSSRRSVRRSSGESGGNFHQRRAACRTVVERHRIGRVPSPSGRHGYPAIPRRRRIW